MLFGIYSLLALFRGLLDWRGLWENLSLYGPITVVCICFGYVFRLRREAELDRLQDYNMRMAALFEVGSSEQVDYCTGVDPKGIEKDSPLLSQWRFWKQVANASAVVWIIIAASMMALVAWPLL